MRHLLKGLGGSAGERDEVSILRPRKGRVPRLIGTETPPDGSGSGAPPFTREMSAKEVLRGRRRGRKR